MGQEQITIAIVDDETIFRVLTKKKLEEAMSKLPFAFVMEEFTSGKQFLEGRKEYDIVFMDIAMPELSGIETAQKYREFCPKGILIFLTAYEGFMKEGYKVNAFRYIEKQDDPKEFFEAVRSAVLLLQKEEKLHLQLVNGGDIFLALEDVVYIEAQTRNVMLHTKDKEILPIRSKISDLTAQLDHKGFYLVHRAFLVNMRYARSCMANEVMLSTLESVPVSERRCPEFKKKLSEFHATIN